ncbi:hypothetical protein K144316041_p20320 (plasmid) [Clostridium tetani]|uniref:hypothetical protein n=1 Tax=Clostridium tetani TaxID=1513 RepID=UPI0029539828|nr:hypothetical protein [Clostridium tetani]BDR74193.1 hypothetical protein K144316041_p20320 [Clostridium tetani]
MVGFVLMLVCLGVIGLVMRSNRIEAEKVEQDKSILVKDIFTKYLGGFPTVSSDDKRVELTVKDNGVVFNFLGRKPMQFISKKDLLNAEVRSESQITEDISLGRVLAFGVVGLAMKKKNTVNKNYLVISYNDKGQKRDVIMETSPHLTDKIAVRTRELIRGIY